MTRRSPSSVVDSYSTLPVRQSPASASASAPSPAAFYDFANPAAMGPATLSDVVRDSRNTAATTASKASQCFLLADMDGRSVRDNHVCAACIAQLRPHEVAQIEWHLDDDDDCRLCQVAATKPEAFTKPFCDFLTENPTVFHTVDYCKTKLHSAGYQEVSAPPKKKKKRKKVFACLPRSVLTLFSSEAALARVLGRQDPRWRQVLRLPQRQLHHRLCRGPRLQDGPGPRLRHGRRPH